MAFEVAYELLPTPPHSQPDWVSWQELSPWIRTPIKAPLFLLGNCPAQLLSYYHDHVGEADTGIYRLKNTGVTRSGMIIHDSMLVASNQLGHSADYCERQVSSGQVGDPDRYLRRHVESAVLLLGGGYDIYGHWLVDIMPNLFALHLVGLKLSDLYYLIPSDIQAFGLSWLAIVGIEERQMIRYDPVDEIVVAEELIVPVLLRSGSRASSLFRGAVDFILLTIDRHSAQSTQSTSDAEAVFISRARSNRDGRSLRNREEIEAMAVDQGYELVYPELMPVGEQVALFRRATRIIGEYGSGLHGSVFSPQDSRVCSLRGSARHPGFLQSGLAQALNQECGYVLGDAPIDAIQYQFAIDPDHVRQALRLMSLPRA